MSVRVLGFSVLLVAMVLSPHAVPVVVLRCGSVFGVTLNHNALASAS